MSYSILIVDDSIPMRTVFYKNARFQRRDTAAQEFWKPQTVTMRLTVLAGDWVDLIVTDYNMPEMNGLSFLKEVKADDLFKEIPVVIISTEGNDAKIEEFMNAGAAGYITKTVYT